LFEEIEHLEGGFIDKYEGTDDFFGGLDFGFGGDDRAGGRLLLGRDVQQTAEGK
jgi:hypothetical protein